MSGNKNSVFYVEDRRCLAPLMKVAVAMALVGMVNMLFSLHCCFRGKSDNSRDDPGGGAGGG